MDRRREPRIQAYETVHLTVLGNAGYSTVANAIQLSAHGMRLVMDGTIPVNAIIKVEGDDWLALGEVCYCRLERSHSVVGLELDQALVGLAELGVRSRAFSAEEPLASLDEAEQLLS